MSDVMLHGVLKMSLPDDPSECDLVTWTQFKGRAREASARIEELEAEYKALRRVIADVINSAGDDPEIMAASRAEWAARAKAAEARIKELEAKLAQMQTMSDFFDFQDGNGPVPAHKHPNGGGWVADTALVSRTAYVGPNARVYGKALVSGDARVYGDAWVSGNAQVSGDAMVYGDAWVSGNAQVSGDAMVSGNAWVSGNAQVSGDAMVSGNAGIYGYAQVYGDARVYDDAHVYGYAHVYGNAQVKRGYYTTTPTSITRSDSYTFTLQSDGSIVAECRDFTPEEADAHWGSPDHHKHAESMAIVNALRAIDAARKMKGQDNG